MNLLKISNDGEFNREENNILILIYHPLPLGFAAYAVPSMKNCMLGTGIIVGDDFSLKAGGY